MTDFLFVVNALPLLRLTHQAAGPTTLWAMSFVVHEITFFTNWWIATELNRELPKRPVYSRVGLPHPSLSKNGAEGWNFTSVDGV